MTLRRAVLLTGGTAIVATLAGCVDGDGSGDETASGNGGTDEADGTDDPTENGDTDGNGETDGNGDADGTGDTDSDTTGESDERQLDSPEKALEGFYDAMNGVESIEEYFTVVEEFFHSDSPMREEWETAAEDEDYRAELEAEIEAALVLDPADPTVLEDGLTADELVDDSWFRESEAEQFAPANALVETTVELTDEEGKAESWTETWVVARENDDWQLVTVQLKAQVAPATAIEWSYNEDDMKLEIRHVGGDSFTAGNVEIDGENAYGHAGNTWDEYGPDMGPESAVSAGDRIVLSEETGGAVGGGFEINLFWEQDGTTAVLAQASGPDA